MLAPVVDGPQTIDVGLGRSVPVPQRDRKKCCAGNFHNLNIIKAQLFYLIQRYPFMNSLDPATAWYLLKKFN